MSPTKPDQLLLSLAPTAPPLGSHSPVKQAVRDGSYVYVSGQVAFHGEAVPERGKVGRDMSLAAATTQARMAAANSLHRLKHSVGSLDHVEQILKMTVYVNAVEDFADHPSIADGASSVLHEVLGDRGYHARAAVGVSSLPLGVPVEVQLVARAGPS